MNSTLLRLGILLLFGLLTSSLSSAQTAEIVSVERIWNGPKHDAFTDLIRFKGDWFCTFRESDAHVGGEGKIRVLRSKDGKKWETASVLTEAGIDLRDPKFSIAPKNRLMLVMGGSVYEGKKLLGKQPRVAFSKNGEDWSAPQPVLAKGDWLWRVTWHKDRAYGISYNSSAKPDWTVDPVESKDGISWNRVTRLQVPGHPNEATLRFDKKGRCIALVRRETEDKQAWIGTSSAPYTEWKWKPAGMQVGGPNFIILKDGRMLASGRKYGATWDESRTFVGSMTLDRVSPEQILPSGGDTSYAGMVWHKDMLWLSYYSSHEKNSDIYLAKIRWPQQKTERAVE